MICRYLVTNHYLIQQKNIYDKIKSVWCGDMKKNKKIDADNFEIMVSQIITLLEGEKAEVKWNERIVDPDNPSQQRQIDVLVRKDDLITLIECRLHKSRQDVKWIEELIGRQASLRADAIIAVSSSGFTTGAVAKAKQFGINLRSVDELSSTEIIAWCSPIKISLFYWRFINFQLNLFFDSCDLNGLNKLDVMDELKKHPYLHNLLTAHFNIKDNSGLTLREKLGKEIHYQVNLAADKFVLSGSVVKKIHTDCTVILEELPLNIPSVLIYRDPFSNNNGVYIQNFNLGETRVIHKENNISINLDISKLNLPPSCHFMFSDFSSNETVNIEYFELIGAENLQVKPDQINFDINLMSVG